MTSTIEESFSSELINEAIIKFHIITQSVNISFLLVGAYARDLFLGDNVASRKTNDIDFAVMVESWDEFGELRSLLEASGEFTSTDSDTAFHKMWYKGEIEIDFVPFGGIVPPRGVLTCWPGKFDREISLVGFKEAYDNAQDIIVKEYTIKTLDIESFVVLKLVAWNDNNARRKDATDIRHVCAHYLELKGREDILWTDKNIDIIEKVVDYERQVVRVLGREIARKFMPETITLICKIIENGNVSPHFKLPNAMKNDASDFEKSIEILNDIYEGIQDILTL
jgi:predicted nucleotidyltransferase